MRVHDHCQRARPNNGFCGASRSKMRGPSSVRLSSALYGNSKKEIQKRRSDTLIQHGGQTRLFELWRGLTIATLDGPGRTTCGTIDGAFSPRCWSWRCLRHLQVSRCVSHDSLRRCARPSIRSMVDQKDHEAGAPLIVSVTGSGMSISNSGKAGKAS